MEISPPRYQLYPEIEPLASGHLNLDPIHEMYWEVSGKSDGVPVVFLHGGPGAGASPIHRRFFDPNHYRIIVFDQRGSGRSRPFAEVTNNTTQLLIQDMEKLRKHLNVERWLVFGGSWGSSLALAYAIDHPDQVSGLVLRGIFLCRDTELTWFLEGIAAVFPEAWQDFIQFLPEAEQKDVLSSYHQRLVSDDPNVHGPAARAWARYEGSCSTLLPSSRGTSGLESGRAALALARIEAHYFVNKMFLPDAYFFENLYKIRHIPAVFVQGRYDMICPMVTADALARAWPEAQYHIISDAGHSAMEPGVQSALVAATEQFKAGG